MLPINFDVEHVRDSLRDDHNIRSEIFHTEVPDGLNWLGVYPKWRDHTGIDRWTVIAGPFALSPQAHGGPQYIANLGVFEYKNDTEDDVPVRFDRQVSEQEVATAIRDRAERLWAHEDAEDLVDPKRTFFSGEWLANSLDDGRIRWEYCVEGTLTGQWSGGCSFLTDQVAVEHIITSQVAVQAAIPGAPAQWFQWDGDTLVFVFSDGPEPTDVEVQLVEPTVGGEYEMGFGWTWYDVDPLQCDLVFPESMNWQNIVSMVKHDKAEMEFIRDPSRWLERRDITTVPAWVVDEAQDRIGNEKPEPVHLPAQSYTSTNPNVNCLEGVRCPKCGQYTEVEVKAVVWVMLQDDGITDERDHYYDLTAPAHCSECGFLGTWGDFQVKPTMTAGQMIAELQKIPAETPLLGYIGAGVENYVNVDGVHFDPTNPDIAATIELRDDYDTRQW